MGRNNKQYEVVIEKTAFPGFGLATINEKKIYVKNTLPGQKLLVGGGRKKKGRFECKLLSLLEDVDYKVEAKCPHFYRCGGCTHQFITYEKQLDLKKDQVLSLLEEGEIEGYEFLGIEESPDTFEYRNKMEFTFGDEKKGGELELGLHVKGSSFGIITVENCVLVDEDFRKILTIVIEYFREKKFPHYKIMSRIGYLRNLVVRKGINTGEIMINLVTTSQIDFDLSELRDILLSQNYKGKIESLLHSVNDSFSEAVIIDKLNILHGRDYIFDNVLGLTFKISPLSFFQTNTRGAESLYSIVREFMGSADNKVVFDLYSGTGTIGQLAAANASKVIGVELIEEAVKSANENSKLNNLSNCEFLAGDVGVVVKSLNIKPDIIILDPPRVGVSSVALENVINFDAKDIVYVSCNPVSLVENLKELIIRGYIVEKIKLMDMFPNTPHIESVVKLSKRMNH